MSIRYGGRKDAAVLSEMGAQTFWETYNTSERLEKKYIRAHIASTFDPERIRADLAEEKTIYLLAEASGEAVGYARLLLESSRPEIKAQKPLEISRIYLLKDFWGQGLGWSLLENCLAEAEKHLCDAIWLSVWQYNPRAIAFYEKYGFRKVGEHFFDLASSPQADFVMLKSLKVEK
ncbi:MAG: GNAT family N-acetyltransferase [Pyrinomonadaceae bacterium]